jgi:branched-chain amino acid transport system substrate-binding protein
MVLSAPSILRAEEEMIKIGALVPLSGSGGAYGPDMIKAAQYVVDQVNGAGGVLGKQVKLFAEDDQTNPDAGVRGARKLIEVDGVAAIIGTWASSVTTAIAPLCWESKTFLATTSGADSITHLPHLGYIARTNPTSTLLGQKFAQWSLDLGGKNIFYMSPQTPFANAMYDAVKAVIDPAGGKTGMLIYDEKKPTLRTEVDEAMRFSPDVIIMAGYSADTAVLMRELFRAGYKGKAIGFGYSVNNDVVSSLPADVSKGVYTFDMASAVDSVGFKTVSTLLNQENPDSAVCQIFDHMNLVLLAMAQGNGITGEVVKDNLRKISQGGGTKVTDVISGLKAIAAGTKIDYDGASGPCDFNEIGDVTEGYFRYAEVTDGQIKLIAIK